MDIEPETSTLRAALQMLRMRTPDLNLDDATCTRFLIARQNDVKKTEIMIRNNLKWRQEVEIENLYRSGVPDYLQEAFPCRFTGVSTNGGPVVYLPVGLWKVRHLMESGKKQEIVNYILCYLEMCLSRLKELGNNPCVIIYDLKGLSYYEVAHLDNLKLLYTSFQTMEQNYPEVMQSLLIVNAPWVFTIPFNFIKPILSDRTMGKIQVHGSDRSQWLPVLRKFCLDEAIPEECL